MSCEYAKGHEPIKCEITARPCLVLSDEDKTAYRHCLAREWKHKLDDRHSSLLARPCSALEDIAPQVAQNSPLIPLA